MIAKIKKFVKDSYTFSPLAFWCEMIEATFLITASAILTFTVLDPATKIFIPLYFVGSALGIVSAVIRKAAFVILLCSWFTTMNAIALVQLFIL
jgi:hypothetical protein|tara:strand:- start:286 stop:567 length:282 start_codon:yes stop_codon:yes gene_type:complete